MSTGTRIGPKHGVEHLAELLRVGEHVADDLLRKPDGATVGALQLGDERMRHRTIPHDGGQALAWAVGSCGPLRGWVSYIPPRTILGWTDAQRGVHCMTQQAVGYEDCDISLLSGKLRVRRWGAADAPAVLCVPGLSANLCGFDRLAERLAGDTLQLVAIDMRGRGRSDVTGPGTYGWRNHARDVLGIADAVGAPSFAVIGQSSGVAIAMTCAQLAPSRVERLVLVDLAGSPDERAGVPIVAAVSRLGTVYPSAEAAIALVKQLGIVPEWDEYWDRYYGYELREVDGGVTASTDKGAVLEDLGYGNAMYWSEPEAPVHALWTAITMPALVLRAAQEILPGFGFILPAAEAERFAAAVPSARVVEIDANHYTITTHDDSIAGIEEFLRTS